MAIIDDVIARWKRHLGGDDPDALDDLLADDVVFYSPIVYTPQAGKEITKLYLQAAEQTFPGSAEPASAGEPGAFGGGTAFRYTKEVLAGDTAVLEFETRIDGKYVNGVDIIRADDDGQIVEFRVMIRPLQAVNLVHAQMQRMLEQLAGPDGGR